LKRREIIGGIYLRINIMNVVKPIISVLLMPIAIAMSVVIVLAAIQIAIHEALWKDKES
tara:strand:+ start:1014 stop:1190 length:177 start_codon:yes stop_codon:yes gene_type:complete